MRALPTLRQLRYLVTVAETLHFGKAADICNVTQSTLSAGIQDLEDLLGVVLIERQSRRKVVMTPLGENLVQRSGRILREAEALVEAAHAGAHPLVGDLRLGVIPTIGPYVLPRCLPAARAAYPNLRLYLREEQTARLLDDLAVGRVDVALLALPYDIGEMTAMELWEEDVVVAAPRGHPLAGHSKISQKALAEADLLMLEDGHCLRGHALQACSLRGPSENEAFQATSLGTLVQMVANGLGVTLLPRSAIAVEVPAESGIVVRELENASPARRVALVWRPASPRSRDFRLLGNLLRASAPTGAVMLPASAV